jgi:hypothetical protein
MSLSYRTTKEGRTVARREREDSARDHGLISRGQAKKKIVGHVGFAERAEEGQPGFRDAVPARQAAPPLAECSLIRHNILRERV